MSGVLLYFVVLSEIAMSSPMCRGHQASHLARKPARLHLAHTVVRCLTGFLGSWLPCAGSERERERLSTHSSNGSPANAAGRGFALRSPSSQCRRIILLRGHYRPWFNPAAETESDPAGRSSSRNRTCPQHIGRTFLPSLVVKDVE